MPRIMDQDPQRALPSPESRQADLLQRMRSLQAGTNGVERDRSDTIVARGLARRDEFNRGVDQEEARRQQRIAGGGRGPGSIHVGPSGYLQGGRSPGDPYDKKWSERAKAYQARRATARARVQRRKEFKYGQSTTVNRGPGETIEQVQERLGIAQKKAEEQAAADERERVNNEFLARQPAGVREKLSPLARELDANQMATRATSMAGQVQVESRRHAEQEALQGWFSELGPDDQAALKHLLPVMDVNDALSYKTADGELSPMAQANVDAVDAVLGQLPEGFVSDPMAQALRTMAPFLTPNRVYESLEDLAASPIFEQMTAKSRGEWVMLDMQGVYLEQRLRKLGQADPEEFGGEQDAMVQELIGKYRDVKMKQADLELRTRMQGQAAEVDLPDSDAEQQGPVGGSLWDVQEPPEGEWSQGLEKYVTDEQIASMAQDRNMSEEQVRALLGLRQRRP